MAQSVTPQHGRTAGGRPAWLLPVALSALVVIVAAVVVLVLTSRDDASAPPDAVVTTVVLPVPTPTVAPIDRGATTTFSAALPTTLLQYALAATQADAEWQAAGALEAWHDSFTDGGSGTVVVRAGQWETSQEAAAFLAQQVAGLPPAPAPTATAGETAGGAAPVTGEVVVGGAPVGTYTIGRTADGTGVAVWSNGTAVFRIDGPADQIANLYAAFPL